MLRVSICVINVSLSSINSISLSANILKYINESIYQIIDHLTLKYLTPSRSTTAAMNAQQELERAGILGATMAPGNSVTVIHRQQVSVCFLLRFLSAYHFGGEND